MALEIRTGQNPLLLNFCYEIKQNLFVSINIPNNSKISVFIYILFISKRGSRGVLGGWNLDGRNADVPVTCQGSAILALCLKWGNGVSGRGRQRGREGETQGRQISVTPSGIFRQIKIIMSLVVHVSLFKVTPLKTCPKFSHLAQG